MHLSKYLNRLALTLVLVSCVGCERGPDPAEKVSRALKEANLDEVKVDWDERSNVAHLSGNVDRATERRLAEDIAGLAVGTSGTVLNEISVEGTDAHTQTDLDGQIRSRLNRMVDNDQALRGRDIAFGVSDGVVVVKGQVRSLAEKDKVTYLVRSVPGVKEVANSLDVRLSR